MTTANAVWAGLMVLACAVFFLAGFRIGARYQFKKMVEAFEKVKKEFDYGG